MMASIPEERIAVEQLTGQLRDAAAAVLVLDEDELAAVRADGGETQYQYGLYWAANGMSAQFSSGSKSASAGVLVPDSRTGLSVRFIRHA